MSTTQNVFVGVWGFRNGQAVIGGGGGGVSDHADLSNVTANQHHDQVHAADGADHTFPNGGGVTYLDDDGNFTEPQGTGVSDHADLSNVTANQHHDQVHSIDGADHTFPNLGGATYLDDDGNFTTPAGGAGDVVGPASSVDDRIACFSGVTGKLIAQGTITCTAVASHVASTANPHDTDIGNLGTGTLAELNAAVTDATLDTNTASRPPTAHAIDGALHTFPNSGGTTYLDDDGNFTTPAGGTGDVIQIGAPVEDESVAVYDDTTGKKIKGGGPVATSIVTRSTTTSEIDEVPVFTDTASKVITGSGIKFINGALCVKQQNGEAFALTLGDLISKSTTVPGEVLLTTGTSDLRCFGPIAIGGAAGADVWIAILGEATVKCDLSSVLLTGFLDPSPTPGRAHTHPAPTDLCIGMPITTKGPAVLGTVRLMMTPREYF